MPRTEEGCSMAGGGGGKCKCTFLHFFCTFHCEPFFALFALFLHFFALVSTALSELFSLF